MFSNYVINEKQELTKISPLINNFFFFFKLLFEYMLSNEM